MNKEKAIDKIRKLLALAQSDNAGEAENALLAARKLMADHKLTERDVSDAKQPGKLNHRVYEAQGFSAVKNSWFIDLSHVIAENHCCAMAASRRGRSTVNHVIFTGLGDDPDIALTLFDYAVQHIQHQVARFRASMPDWYDRKRKNERVRIFEQSYAMGFNLGIKKKYAEQFRDEQGEVTETALVLVQPVEVKRYQESLKSRTMNCRTEQRDSDAIAEGFQAGYNFDPTKQIVGGMA